MAVKEIFYGHHLTLIGPYTSLQGVFQGPLWYYLIGVPIFLLKGNPIGGNYLMVFLSMLLLVVNYFAVKKFFGVKAALITTFLFAVSPEAIAAATYTWNPHPMWILTVLYIFSFYLVLSGKEKFQLALWFLIGLMFNFEAALAFFILAATFIYFVTFERKKILNKYFAFGLLLLALTFLPQALFELRHHFLMTKSVISLFFGHKQGLETPADQTKYLPLMVDHIKTFYTNFNSGFINLGAYVNSFLLLLFILPVFIFKKIKLLSENENKFVNLLFRLVAIIFVLSFAYPFPIRYWFLTGFQSFYILFIGLIISKLLKFKVAAVLFALLFFFFTFVSVYKIHTLYVNNHDYGGAAKIKGQEQAIDYVYKDAKGKPFGLFIFTPPVYTYQYDYLLWWYAQPKYHYLPYQEKKETFYLLMQVDTNQPWSYKGWMETVIKTGKIIYTKTLQPSGFIIQERQG
jgi:4-amino-4-deoxy-L-arabinose transferase-like glycosyltransferase